MTSPRDYFPRGLVQPEGAFRFSADALLLASFAARELGGGGALLDLGTGCGVVAFGVLLAADDRLRAAGLELSGECVEAARENAALLGLSGRFGAVRGDVRDFQGLRDAGIEPESFDAVTANPPYRAPGTGRMASGEARAAARFETEATLGDFLRAAAYAVKNRGRFYGIYLSERLPLLFSELVAARLEPKRLLCVHGRSGTPARLVLVEALKNGRPGLRVEPPLALYDGRGAALSAEVLEFCPYLACNRREP